MKQLETNQLTLVPLNSERIPRRWMTDLLKWKLFLQRKSQTVEGDMGETVNLKGKACMGLNGTGNKARIRVPETVQQEQSQIHKKGWVVVTTNGNHGDKSTTTQPFVMPQLAFGSPWPAVCGGWKQLTAGIVA